ncbi:heterokaryon incompatibility protein-domain-containing protein [Podospora aff. communis PSN243]|uniref:Heterokaryon incompatibility protein-domain-containing protein n=1 Tax=Podospora aff. communis PSN243 TaxID=3040156 RepID=A0AAV9GL10_9PEZI|nr:heterokaryon incompatibility protein-domain-containing protein [Podospora aff. communis PSN243]
MAEYFQYKPLDSSNKQIRLVRLLGTPLEEDSPHHNDPIQLRIVHATLDGRPDEAGNLILESWDADTTGIDSQPPPDKYFALSYTWGAPFDGLDPEWNDPQPTHVVYANGCEFMVRRNLLEALRHLRRKGFFRLPIWIDAMCINQDDLGEREAQVRRMDEIYASALATVVWLGPASAGSSLAFPVITDLSASWHRREKELQTNMSNGLSPEQIARYREFAEIELGDANAREMLVAMKSLLTRHWFHRAWVAQEVILKGTVVMLCGGSSRMVGLDELHATTAALMQHSNYVPKFCPEKDLLFGPALRAAALQAGRVATLMQLREEFRHAKQIPIRRALSYLREQRATDPRDKIFAALGFCGGEDRSLIHIDYAAPVQVVYTRFTRSWIQRELSLGILAYCYHSATTALPSWVVDWCDFAENAQDPSDILIDHHRWQSLASFELHNPLGNAQSEKRYAAGRNHPLLFEFDNDGKTLTLHGVRVGEVMGTHNHSLNGLRDSQGRDKGENRGIDLDQILDSIFRWIVRTLGEDSTAGGLAPSSETSPNDRIYADSAVYPPTSETLTDAVYRTVAADLEAELPIPGYPRRLKSYMAPLDISTPSNIWWIGRAIITLGETRALFATRDGYLGLGPNRAREGDVVFVIPGNETPLVLRPLPGTQDKFTLVGECYVHGIMDGQALDDYTDEVDGQNTVKTQTIYLV